MKSETEYIYPASQRNTAPRVPLVPAISPTIRGRDRLTEEREMERERMTAFRCRNMSSPKMVEKSQTVLKNHGQTSKISSVLELNGDKDTVGREETDISIYPILNVSETKCS